MSVCGQSGPDEEGSSEDVTAAGAALRDLYKHKPVSKVVRVLTVLAYLLSVSLAAILLSVYYVCVWKSPTLPPLNETDPATAMHHGSPHDYAPEGTGYNVTGGGGSGVNVHVDPSHHHQVNYESSTTADPTTDYPDSSTTDYPGSSTTDSETTFPSEASGANDTSVT